VSEGGPGESVNSLDICKKIVVTVEMLGRAV